MVQSGKADTVSWWPMLVEEFERARIHYEELGISERCRADLNEGGHVVRAQTGIEFLDAWL